MKVVSGGEGWSWSRGDGSRWLRGFYDTTPSPSLEGKAKTPSSESEVDGVRGIPDEWVPGPEENSDMGGQDLEMSQ